MIIKCIPLASIGLIFLPGLAGAAATGWVPVTETVTYRTSNQFVAEVGGSDTNGCNTANRYVISTTDSNYDAVVSTILTAVTAGRKIQIAFQGGPTGCVGNFARIDNVSYR